MKRPLAYITAPWSNSQYENAESAAAYCRQVYDAGYSPICPVLFLPTFLKDEIPQEHKDGQDTLSGFGMIACGVATLPASIRPLADVALAVGAFLCHLDLLFRRMADVFFFLLLEGVEPVCLQLSRHAPRQFEARREAHQRGFRQQ